MGEIAPPKGLPESVRTLILTFDTANGNFQVAGPITDRALCYGMLDLAHDEIFKFNEQQALLKEGHARGTNTRSSYPMMCREEKIKDTLEEAKPLLYKHWQEVAHYKDIPLDPDYSMYLKMEEAGMIRAYAARDGQGVLIGYAVYVVRPNLHYKCCLTATEDIIFIDPERRGVGMFFLRWCDQQLKSLGVQVVTHHIKFAHDWSPALLRMGYEKTDMSLSKRLDLCER